MGRQGPLPEAGGRVKTTPREAGTSVGRFRSGGEVESIGPLQPSPGKPVHAAHEIACEAPMLLQRTMPGPRRDRDHRSSPPPGSPNLLAPRTGGRPAAVVPVLRFG